MVVFSLAGLFATAGLGLLFWQWRAGRGSDQFVLAGLPYALLILVAPIPFLLIRLIREFQRFATGGGADGPAHAIQWCLSILHPLRLGYTGLLVTLAVAAGLQVLARRRTIAPSPDPEANSSPWRRWILLVTSLVTIPALLLAQSIKGVSNLLMNAVVHTLAPEQVGPTSDVISTRFTFGVLGGFALTGLLFVLILANLLLKGTTSREDKTLTAYASFVLVAVVAIAVWGVIGMTTDIATLSHRTP